MSDDGNEDHWLYGNSINPEPPATPVEDELMQRNPDAPEPLPAQDDAMEVLDDPPPPVPGVDAAPLAPPIISAELLLRGDNAPPELEAEEKVDEVATEATETEAGLNGDDDDDSDDDGVQVVIKEIVATPNYSSINIKRGGLLTSAGPGDKLKQPGKFNIEEFETVGTINGHEAIDFNLDSLEEKPWRKPGADITDYFNYGFNEETWRSYCERQKRIRIHESGVGLNQLGPGGGGAGRGGGPNVNIANDNSKYTSWEGANFLGQKKAGPPPGRRYAGSIDVIGGGGLASRRGLDKGAPPSENAIQVMTADRRDYSRKPGFPDMSMPPPPAGVPPPFDVPPPVNVIARIGPPSIPSPFMPRLDPYGHPLMGGGDFYQPPPEPEPYYHSYEPTQDCQWNDPAKQSWQPTSLATLPIGGGVKVLTPAPPPQMVPQPSVIHPPGRDGDSTPTQGDSIPDEVSTPRDKEDSGGPITALGVVIKEEPKDPEERGKERTKEKHKDRSHRHRSRSRSTERRSRRHKSRSRSPGHRSHRKKKSRRSEREGKEDSE